MNKAVLCGHTGSVNRGCEAIIRSTADILKKAGINSILATHAKEQDLKANINEFDEIIEYKKIKRFSLEHLYTGTLNRIFKYSYPINRVIQINVWNKLKDKNFAINVGGDTYCYDTPIISYNLNKFTQKNKIKNILWGCSIEKKLITETMKKDLDRYSLVLPRETITYNSLIEIGINEDKLRLISDPAFVLKMKEVKLPNNFDSGNTVGINLSPIVIRSAKDENIALNGYYNVIEYILKNSDMKIALIPHVYTNDSEDIIPLKKIYDRYKYTNRVIIFDSYYNCMQLKYIISKCRFLVAARTHASIAAYSTCVPTLVVGYSVKARGIARDIFGSEEKMVIPVQSLKNKDDLVNAFKYIQENEDSIRKHLIEFMPGYIEKAWQAGEELRKLMGEY